MKDEEDRDFQAIEVEAEISEAGKDRILDLKEEGQAVWAEIVADVLAEEKTEVLVGDQIEVLAIGAIAEEKTAAVECFKSRDLTDKGYFIKDYL